ncbi:MAG: hypothetical protein GXO73_01490 [Calditrichaeota bacterium]|nr:hypothetical protein [Calditrichota bacterium]
MRRRLNKRLQVAALAVLLPSLALVSTGRAQNYGGYGGELLRYGVGGRATGMAGAFTGVADDASAIFYNPAGLVQADRATLGLYHARLFYDVSYNFFSASYPLYNVLRQGDKLVLGLGYVGFGMSGFERREAGTHRLIGHFEDTQASWLLPVAYDYLRPWGRLGVGGQLVVYRHSIAGYQAQSTGLDLGLLFQPLCLGQSTGLANLPGVGRWFDLEHLMRWRVGLVLKTRGSIKLKESAEDLPSSLHFGISRSMIKLPLLPGRALLGFETSRLLGAGSGWRTVVGGEYAVPVGWGVTGFLRGGYRVGKAGQGRRTVFGFGAHLAPGILSGIPALEGADFDFSLDENTALAQRGANFFLTLRFGLSREDVWQYRSNSERDWSRMKSDVLLRLLTWHGRDLRLLTSDSAAVRVDALYRDGQEAGAVTGVAEELMSRVKRGSPWYDSFEDFVGRICLPVPALCAGLCSGGSESLRELLVDFEQARSWSRAQLPDIRRKVHKICRPKNQDCVGALVQIALLGDDRTLAQQLLGCVPADSATFYGALVNHDEKALADEAATSSNVYHRVYFRFVLGVKRGSVAFLDSVRQNPVSWQFACCAYPRTSPYVPDGTLGDDAELLSLCLNRSLSPGQRWAGILSLYHRMPGSSAGRLIAKTLKETGSDLDGFARTVVSWYNAHVTPSGILWDAAFWQRKPAS